MAEFVKITYGSAAVGALVKNTRKVCIIGKATSFSGVIDGVNDASVLIDGTTYPGIVSTDPLYLGAKDFLAQAGGSSDLVVYGVPTSASTESDVEFNGSALVWYIPYSPASGISGKPEMYMTQTGISLHTGWYDITGGYSLETAEGVWNGVLNIDSTGLSISGVDAGRLSGVFMVNSDERIRADIIKDPMSDVYAELKKTDYAFQFFAFAYDPSDSCPSDPTVIADFKYASGNCYGGKSWLHDLYVGKSMADQFNAVGQRTVFIHSLPEKVKPNERIVSGYSAGTSFATGTTKYEELKTAVGTDKFLSTASAKQNGDANAIDPAVEVMATRMVYSPRLPLTFAGGSIGQTTYPDSSEANSWRRAQINSFMNIKGLAAPAWGGNYTFGNGTDANLNHIQCKNLLAYKIEERLYALLATRTLKYDYAGIKRIKGVIYAALNEATTVDGIIDGVGTVTIPIEDVAKKEADGSITAAEQTIMDAARATKIVDSISVTYIWSGDIEEIRITTFVNE